MFEEKDVTGPNIAMNYLDLSEVLATFQQLLEEGQLLSKRPRPICLPPVLSDLKQRGVGALKQQHQNLLIRVDSIHKGVLKRKEEVPVLFADLFLMHPNLLQSLLEGKTVITAKGQQSHAILNASQLILDRHHGITERIIARIRKYLFDYIQLVVDVDRPMRDLVEDWQCDLQFVVVLDFEGEDVGGGIQADD